jgi:hypothetical protein
LKLLLLSFPPSSTIRNTLFVKKFLLRFTMNAMSEEDIGRDEDRGFRTFRYLSNLVTDLLMLLTYGILCPFVTFLVLWSIVVNELIDHMQVGSYVYDMARSIDKQEEDVMIENKSTLLLSPSIDKQKSTDKKLDTLGVEGRGGNCERELVEMDITSSQEEYSSNSVILSSLLSDNSNSVAPLVIKKPSKVDKVAFQFELVSRIYLDNCSELVMSVWSPMVLVILFFMTLILFDMIADVYGNVAGLVSVIVLWLFVYLLFGSGKKGLDRIVSCLKRTRTNISGTINGEDYNKNDANNEGVEINNMQVNPMQAKI